ncbi:hypothetical protein EXIGLDRAFT_845747 [Exidia glandulosa HHB12029]|uniref:F-box domain-containing protein n=1 Tax=Exidia glandulosa HHB12029 TaxID=1314781 RepID=A0A165BAV4_EXIGL|nr:hypothetical protein EXIGLDRAFT_845747 [Exidia glandulosa HHB12029]
MPTSSAACDDLSLPPELEAELVRSVLPVFDKALALAETSISYESTTQIIAAFTRCIAANLAPVLRRRNARTARLPGEILCAIWKLLSVEDRVTATHVCSSWRDLAILTRHIWTDLDFYTSLHNDDCWCKSCAHRTSPDVRAAGLPTWGPGRTNIGILRNIVARSGELPLSLRVECADEIEPSKQVPRLAACLRLHLDRLQDITFFAELSDNVCNFFDAYSDVPGGLSILRRLRCRSNCEYGIAPLALALPSIPNVETLILECGLLNIQWNGLQLPSVRRLRCGFRNMSEILRALAVSPKLESLDLDLEGFNHHLHEHAIPAQIHAKAMRLHEITVRGATPRDESILFSMFRVPLVRSLSFIYSGQPRSLGFAIFRDVRDDIHLHIAYQAPTLHSAPKLEVTATDSAGHRRSLTFERPVADGTSLQEYIPEQSVTSLTVPAAIWPRILRDVAVFPSVRSATLEFGTLLGPLLPTIDGPVSLPALETMRLVPPKSADGAPNSLAVSVKEVAAYVAFLKGSPRLDKLILDGIALDGDVEELMNIVGDIVRHSM